MKTYKATRNWPKIALIAGAAMLLAGGGWFGWQQYEQHLAEQEAQEQAEREAAEREAQEAAEPESSLEERFVERYYEVDLPGVEPISDPPDITGNPQADQYIRDIAEDRGYRLQFEPARELEEVDGEEMQPETAEAWRDMRDAASAEGISLSMVSAFRDIETQAIIFDSALRARADEVQGRPFTSQQILDGEADEIIDDILSRSSIPGYSKHHSGHTIDVTDGVAGASLEDFGQTNAFEWLSADDYAKSREFGFLPSYPEGVDNLGPDPELWEFVWVGVDNVDFD